MTSTSEIGYFRDVETVCERCHGSGVLLFEVASHLNYVRWDSVLCPNCHGTGEAARDA